ncbi:DUF4321 domain-containing protein [Clostridium frigidicarnis]|uniref:DUF4321 domain-containing protein n=1 Tax=Clostridium frigidicarnis TaxID=84698 RepID=A0A1I1A599_9CLOT|nr:DUF4321 domain-containing protein [Clostridium frigidicarnis]SFB31603.1 protein of unknown function [Clostridium frigidicarnis]
MRDLKGKAGLSLVLIILFAILGNLLGELLGNNIQTLTFLKEFYSIGFTEPLTLDLGIVSTTLGITFKLNIMSMLGIIFAIFVVKKF